MNLLALALFALTGPTPQAEQLPILSSEAIPPFVIRNPSIEIRHVANDGGNVLTGVPGYRLDRQYMLVSDRFENLIFPPSARERMLPKYVPGTVGASLENDVAIASLFEPPGKKIGIEYPAKTWAVYPIDRLADPRPTDIVRTRGDGYLVSASLTDRLLKATFAESISASRVAIVDYEFQLAPRGSEGVFDAKLLKRIVWQRGFNKRLTESGRYVWNAVAVGDVSSDRSKIVRGNKVQSLVDGKITEHDTGSFATNVDFFFIGNDLYRTLTGASTYFWRTDPSSNPFAGVSRYENGKWVRVSEMCLEAISANGMYAVMKDVPKNAEGVAKRYVVRLKN
jgi:hypothetical protein